MERLTERTENERVVKRLSTYGDAMLKLANYEDAEEQGRLFKFPAKIGDHIWLFILKNKEYLYLREAIIDGFIISSSKDSPFVCFMYRDYSDVDVRTLEDFEKSWFLTKEEAELTLTKWKKGEITWND